MTEPKDENKVEQEEPVTAEATDDALSSLEQALIALERWVETYKPDGATKLRN